MREIKFRFWDKEKKRMEPPCSMWWNYIEYLNEEDCEVMQFTGLFDRNGKEIYEGDVIKRSGRIHVVKWQEEKAKFVCYDPKINHPSFWGLTSSASQDYRFKVIGNIYQNPELLNSPRE